jgi:hypothetical protein
VHVRWSPAVARASRQSSANSVAHPSVQLTHLS